MTLRAGFWLVRCCRFCPEAPARIWLCEHEPGEPENLMDRPFWQGQIGLDLTDPAEIWAMLEYLEASPAERAVMERPLSLRADVRAGRVEAAATAPMAKWKRERARRITAAEYDRQIAWLRWAERHQPAHPELQYRRPLTAASVPLPRFL